MIRAVSDVESSSWFGQPKGLTVLFLTNMWEQFSYYGMRALLVYYMTKELLLSQKQSSFIYGAYTACAYFTPIIGGVIADRVIGKQRAVVIGALVMALGHFMMASESLFYIGLATIAIGNGLFLPSLPSQINALYPTDDPRRAWAYNIYYIGINIGAFLAPLVCGTIGELYGWHYGFGAAGIGMLAGVLIYVRGRQYLPSEPFIRTNKGELSICWADHRNAVIVLLGVALAVTVFRAAYEQVGNTVALWADTGVDRSMGSRIIPMTWFQSLNPLLVMLMTPLILSYWRRRVDHGYKQRLARRMALGATFVGAAYFLLAWLVWMAGDARPSWIWLALFFVIFTGGELLILPTGLGLFAKLAPQSLGATTVAAWYFVTFLGSLSAGLIGTWWGQMSHTHFFLMLGGIAITAALLLCSLDGAVRRVDRSP